MVDAVMLDFLFGSNMHLVQLIAIQYNGRNARLSIALPLTTHHAPNSTLHYLLWMRQVRWHARLGTYSRPCRRPLNQPTLARRHARWTGHVWSPERSRQQLGRTGRPSDTTVLYLAAFATCTQSQRRDDTNQRPCRGTQSLARPAVSFPNGCSVLSFSRSRVAVVCVSGLRERPGGFVSAHPHPFPGSS